jgi:hypothetical protein
VPAGFPQAAQVTQVLDRACDLDADNVKPLLFSRDDALGTCCRFTGRSCPAVVRAAARDTKSAHTRAATEGIADGQVSRQVHMVHLGGGITGSGKGKCGVMWI